MTQPLLEVSRIEAAASHQARALSWFRQAQDSSQRMSAARRRCLQLRALEHLLEARRILQGTQPAAAGDRRAMLDQHLARLEQMIASVVKLLETEAVLQEQPERLHWNSAAQYPS